MNSSAKRLANTVVSYLKSQGELGSLPAVVDELNKVAQRVRGENKVVVTTAYKLGEPELKAVAAYVKKELGATYPVENVVDTSLVAGFTLSAGDLYLDSSLKGKLGTLADELSK